MNVNRSTYYKHFFSQKKPRIIENENIKKCLLILYTKYKKRLGAYKLKERLSEEFSIIISVGRVYRLMNSLNLPKMSTCKAPRPTYLTGDDVFCVNHLKQEFNPKSPNQVWASDITYIKVNSSNYYLYVIMDLFARKIIGYTLSKNATAQVLIDLFTSTFIKRGRPTSLMFHSDRGTQYTAFSFRKTLDTFNVLQSFSKKGYPYDNAVVECFFKYLKKEELNRHNFHTFDELKLSIFEYIEAFYNTARAHKTNGYITPNKKESLFFTNLKT